MKRFWTRATIDAGEDGHVVLLDGKPVNIPGGARLRIERPALARAIAAEWEAAGGEAGGDFTLDDLPLTRLAGTAQERIAPDKAPVADALAKYAETDVLCYRAEFPLPLVLQQARAWQPWLDWLEAKHGARLVPTEGVAHKAQDEHAVAAVRAVLLAEPAPVLAGLGIAVPALGSVVLGLALAEGALDADEAYKLAHLDELYQAEHWGEDVWAARRRKDVARDIALAARFIGLVRTA